MGHQDSAPVHNKDINYQTHVKSLAIIPIFSQSTCGCSGQLGELGRLVEVSVTH